MTQGEQDITGIEDGCGAYHYAIGNGWKVEVERNSLVTQHLIGDLRYEIDAVVACLSEFELEHECSCVLTSVTVNGQVYRIERT